MCPCKKVLASLPCILVAIGALNWGLVGAFDIDLVALLFGEMTTAARVVYIIVGLAAVVKIIAMMMCKCGKNCSIK